MDLAVYSNGRKCRYYCFNHVERAKVLFAKLKLKYNVSKRYDLIHKMLRSLNMVYPYQFFIDEKGVPNYSVKSVILEQYSFDLQDVRKYKRAEYLQEVYNSQKVYREIPQYKPDCVKLLSQSDIDFMHEYLSKGESLKGKSIFLFNECYKMVCSDVQRKKRLRQRIERIMNKGCTYFVTLTFSEDTLKNTDFKTRRTYVARLLKNVSSDYVGNVDFGKLKGREHYHAVFYSDKLDDIKYIFTERYGWVCSDCEQFQEWSRLGFYSIKSCGKDDKDKQKLAWYVSKLTNHAVKETTKRNALIYSR